MNRLSSLPKSQNLILAKCVYVQKWWFRWSQCVVECTLSVYARPTGTTLARYHFNVLAVYPQTRCRFNPDSCVSFFGVEREFFRPDPAFRVLSAPIHQIYRLWTYNTGCTMSPNSTNTEIYIKFMTADNRQVEKFDSCKICVSYGKSQKMNVGDWCFLVIFQILKVFSFFLSIDSRLTFVHRFICKPTRFYLVFTACVCLLICMAM